MILNKVLLVGGRLFFHFRCMHSSSSRKEVMGRKPSDSRRKKKKGNAMKQDEKEESALWTSKKLREQKKRKREDLITNKEGAMRGRKRCRTGASIKEKIAKPVDYISQLPDHVIHCILGLLRCRKDAARTCILSKRWKDSWDSFSNLIFDQRKFQPVERNLGLHHKTRNLEAVKKFEEYVHATLHRHIKQRSSIQKLMLHLTSYNLKAARHIDQWINAATKIDIQELSLCIPVKNNKCYSLPPSLFAAKSLIALTINGCRLGNCKDAKFPHLRKLCLGKLHVTEEMVGRLICCCPLIEDLRLIDCNGFSNLQVTELPELKRVDLHFCQGLKKVEILAPKLEAFWYHGKKSADCELNLSTCKSLKHLTLRDAKMKDELFQNYLSSFPFLEKLVLCKCDSLEAISVSSYWLKTLILRDCRNLVVADIDSRNLLSFEYKGDNKMPFWLFKPSTLKEAKLYFEQKEHPPGLLYENRAHFVRLERFLEKFDFSRGLRLVARFKKNIIIYEQPKKVFLPQFYDLKLDVFKSAMGFEDLLDSVLRVWHPETLSIISSHGSSVHKIVHEKIVNREKKPGCCVYNTSGNQCWLHFLENVKIEKLDDHRSGSSTSGNRSGKQELVYWLRTSPAMDLKTSCFLFNWKRKTTKHMKEMQVKA